MEDLNIRFFFFFVNLGMVPKNSTPGKFTSIWLFKRAEIILKEFEKARIRCHRQLTILTVFFHLQTKPSQEVVQLTKFRSQWMDL